MKEMAQVEPPALAGRRVRVADFKQFIETNRKQLEANVLLAQYSIETGISIHTLNDYLKLFYEAKLYHRPTGYSDHKLLTHSEYEEYKKRKEAKWKAEQKRKQKERGAQYPYEEY